MVSACLRLTPCFFLGGDVVTGVCGVAAATDAGVATGVWTGAGPAWFETGDVTRSAPVSLVLLVTDIVRTGRVPPAPGTTGFFAVEAGVVTGFVSFGGGTSSTSSFGIDAILVRNNFSRV